MSAAHRGESVVERHHPLFMLAGLGVSVLLHGVAYASLAAAPRQNAGAAMTSEVAFEVAPPPPTEVEPAPAPPAPQQPEPARAAPRPTPQRAEPPPPEATAQRAQNAVDLSGVTLTNGSGEAGWTSAVGNGSAMRGPQGPVRAAGPAAAVGSAREPSVSRQAPSLVGAADLSQRPRPPALDGVLKRHYPEEARSRGISGTASVRARIGADGKVSHTRVLSESFSGFGEACKRTLAGSRWSPPKNREGSAVATEIAYTCRFVVDR
jgi:periplasmic protein TonB